MMRSFHMLISHLFIYLLWRNVYSNPLCKWQPTPAFLSEKSKGQRSLGRLPSMGLQRVIHDWATGRDSARSHSVVNVLYSSYRCFNRHMTCKYFLPCCDCPFLLMVSSAAQTLLILTNSNWSINSFTTCAFGIVSKKLSPSQSHKDLLLFLSMGFIVLASTFRSMIHWGLYSESCHTNSLGV